MKSHLFLFGSIVMVGFVLMGCGTSSIVVNPDFSRPALAGKSLKREDIRIVEVTDGRKPMSKNIGTVHTGMLNQKTPYILTGSLPDNVKTMLDTLLVVHREQERIFPVKVSVDMFEVGENIGIFSEEGYFACNLQFTYPLSADSMGRRSIFAKQTTSGMDVTDALEPLIYKGIEDCARQFVEGTYDKLQNRVALTADSIKSLAAKDSIQITTAKETKNNKPQPAVSETHKKVKKDELSFQYCQGDKIATGIRGSYLMLSRTDSSQLLWGLGISLTYFDIVNKQDFYKGTFVNFGGRLAARYLFSLSPTSAYIGGNLGLAGGTEKLTSGSSAQSNFFFGPSIEEVLGVSIGGKVCLEVGAFQLAHFGSKLLPSDIGFIVGMSIGLN